MAIQIVCADIRLRPNRKKTEFEFVCKLADAGLTDPDTAPIDGMDRALEYIHSRLEGDRVLFTVPQTSHWVFWLDAVWVALADIVEDGSSVILEAATMSWDWLFEGGTLYERIWGTCVLERDAQSIKPVWVPHGVDLRLAVAWDEHLKSVRIERRVYEEGRAAGRWR